MNRDADTLRAAVRESYAKVATGEGRCCSSGPDVVDAAEAMGYDRDDADLFAEVANLGLGCGAPLTFADLQPGETVLDLGSGAGFDAFLARREMGDEGLVIGVDMTHEMLARARDNAAKLGYQNVQFRLGEIEHLPVADASVDLVISNCVLNLVPDKPQAFREIARVLKPGGRMVVSDIVRLGELPAALLESTDAYCGCLAGASLRDDYLAELRAAGLERVEVLRQVEAKAVVGSTGCCEDERDKLPEGVLASATVRAWKPV